jgi:hypothetical protein
MASARHHFARRASVAAALLLGGHAAYAESEVGAILNTRLAHTDNVSLLPEGFEQPESIAEITAGINFARSEQRHQTQGSYQVQGLFYQESSDSDEVFNTLNLSSKVALVMNHFYVDAYAVHDQTIVDPTQKNSFNKLALTGNRTDVSIVGMSPYVAISVGENTTGEFRLSKARVEYADESLQDDDEAIVFFTLGNPESRAGTSWKVLYDKEEFDYESSPTVEFEVFGADLGYWVSDTVRLFTIQGLESDYSLVEEDPTVDAQSPGLDEHYWYAGVEWRPSDRNAVMLQSGQRSFGDSARFYWNYRSSRGGISISYSEQPSNALREQIRSSREAGELAPIDDLDGPDGNHFYLQERADIAFILDRSRSSAALRFFDERRFDIVKAATESTKEETEEYRGTEVNVSWTVNSVASIGLGAQVARRRSAFNAVDDEIRRVSVNYERRVGRQGSLLITAAGERVDPKSEVGEFQYNEKQFSVALRRWFGTAPTVGAPRRFYGYLDAQEDY